MKKYLVILYGALSFSMFSIAQDKMVVDKIFNGNSYYEGASKPVTSISELPENIQVTINGYLVNSLGTLKNNTKFSHGQTIDLKKYFNGDTTIFKRKWIAPKYDLNFILEDSTIGIKSYYLRLKLDEFGQILYANWPREGYSDKSLFIPRKEVEKFALKQAKSQAISTANYIVDFDYNEEFDKLCWIFKFSNKSSRGKSHVLKIDWISLDILAYNIETTDLVN